MGAALRATAFIPVRGGSKGIVGKNVVPIGGRPLVEWVVRAALGASRIDDVVVSTDDDTIAELAARVDPRVRILRRSEATASDTASTESAMLELVERDDLADPIVLLQATSPLTTSAEIDKAVGLLGDGCDSVVSVVRQRRFCWRADVEGEHGAEPIGFDPRHRPRRQDHDGFLVENGAIYVTGRAGLIGSGCRVNGRVRLLEMPEDTYVELDEPLDVVLVDALLRHRSAPVPPPPSLVARAAAVRLVVTDVDGCLTDNGMYYGAEGDELKRFSARDGKGFELLRDAGVHTMLLTSERSPLLARRAAKLRVDDLVEGSADKVEDADRVRRRLGLAWDEVAFMGDDLHDLGLLGTVGLSACPADATPPVREAVAWRSEHAGGSGAFRELADLVVQART